MSKKRGVFATLILIPAIGIMVFSGCREKTHENMAARIIEEATEELGLNDGQVEHLNTIKEELVEKTREIREDHSSIKDAVIAQLKSDEIDQDKLVALITEHKAKMTETIPLFVSHLAEFHSTLTPEQKDKLVDHLEDMESGRRKHCFFRH